MKKSTVKFKKQDIIFIIWIAVIILTLIIVSIVMFNQNSNNDMNKPTPTPTPTPTISPLPTPDDEIDAGAEYKYEFPRSANISLNPTLAFEQTIGGDGNDTLTEVITLKNSYLFGTTNSSKGDFVSTTSVDCCVSVIDVNGKVIKATTFGTVKDDYILLVKPIIKQDENDENSFIVVTKNIEEKNTLYVYRILENSLSVSSSKISLGDNLTYAKGIVSGDKVMLAVTAQENGEPSGYFISISKDLAIVTSKKIEGIEFVDLLYTPKKTILFGNMKNDKNYLVITEFQNSNINEINKVALQDKERKIKEVTPCSSGGFLVTYEFLSGGLKKIGILKLNSNYVIEFDHVLKGDSYKDVFILNDYGMSELKGFHIFATSTKKGDYSTYYENICVHGDLNDSLNDLFEGVKAVKIIKNLENYVVIGESYKNGSIDIAVLGVNKQLSVLFNYKYGGNGIDIPIGGIINSVGKLLVFGTTTSTGNDITHNFGKSDIWVINPNIEN